MIRLRICLAILLLAVAFFSCSDNDNSITQPTKSWPLILGDVVHFDSSIPILVSVHDPNGFTAREPFVYREKHLGEPFIDINGNGVYDPALDFFLFLNSGEITDTIYIRCDSIVDTTCMGASRLHDWDTAAGWDRTIIYTSGNMDLNHNGQYDSPDSVWRPGIPYDDLNGNGEFDRGMFYSYQPGLPFADLNGNGVYDSMMSYRYSVEKYAVESSGPNRDNYRISLDYMDYPAYVYHSDSGIDYTLTRRELSPIHPEQLQFEIDSAGFWYTGFGNKRLLIFEGPEIHAFSEQEFKITERTSDFRSISVNDSLTINNRLYNRLVSSDITRVYHSSDPTYDWEIAARFYFAPNTLHLIACRLEPTSEDSIWIYLDHRLDSLPLLMIR